MITLTGNFLKAMAYVAPAYGTAIVEKLLTTDHGSAWRL